jgi:hypothetical protein
MPTPARKPYWTAGRRACIECGRPAGLDGRCAKHRKKRKWYSGDWARISRERREMFPICEICGKRPSEQTDHVIPRSMAGGVRALCRPCHHEHGLSWDPSMGESFEQ